MTATNIPKGYKQTEIGIIPEDWKTVFLRYIADVKTGPFGSSLHERDYVDDGTPIITVEHLGERGVVHENLPQVSDFDKKRLSTYVLKTGDIVFSRVGSVDRNSLIKKTEDGWLFSGRLLRIRLTSQNDPSYLSYHFHQEPTKQRIRSVAVGQTMASLNTKILKSIEVVFPPTKAEQKAIATALSDTDELLESLEKLIVKKRNIKQATMQQLLTGNKRLPGFSGNWEPKKLGEFLDYEQPTNYLVTDTEYDNNNQIPVLTAGKTFILGYTNEEFGIFKNLPVIIFDDFTTASKFVEFPFKAKSSAMKMLIPKNDEVNMRFIYEIMQRISFPLGDHKRHWIGEYQYIEVVVPSPQEQTTISQVLRDMDAEIEALEQKRDKYKDIKQGMMQELLTGKTRLL